MKKPWFRKQTQCWYIELVKGKPINLGKDKAAAHEQYHKIMAEGQVSTQDTITVHEVIVLFLEWVEENRKPTTLEFYRGYLMRLLDHVSPKMRVKDFKPLHITEWIKAHFRLSKSVKKKNGSMKARRPVGDNHRHNAIRCAKACLGWAKSEGHIAASPIADVSNYPTSRRETYVTPGDFETLAAAITDDDFREAVMLMRLTGCRPQEVRQAEKRHFDVAGGCLDFPKGEIKGSKENRVVLLDGEAMLMIRRRVARYTSGHLFRNSDGLPWTKDAFVQRFTDLSAKVGVKVTAYTIRHAWATDALARGVPIQFVAKIMGHKGTRMLMEVYNHLEKRTDELRTALKQANGAA
jgi:integrase